MNTLLVIAYFFPPLGGAGVQRTLKFVKYLPQSGWQSIILTASQIPAGPRDNELLSEIPTNTLIEKAPAMLFPSQIPWRVKNFITRWFLIVDEYLGWLPFAVQSGHKIIQTHKPKAIYSTSAPITDHLVAMALARRTNLPWIADFRDPWVGNFMHKPVSPLHNWYIQQLEKQIVNRADIVIANTEPNRQALIARYPQIPPSRFITIPNGFDPADFLEPAAPQPENQSFTLVYTGTFYGKERRLKPLLTAIELCVQNGVFSNQQITLKLVGNIGKIAEEEARQSEFKNIVFPGYLSHRQTLEELLAADACVLVVGSGAGSEGVYPAKIFEYLAAQKPVLCLSDAGIAADLILSANAGVVASPEDPKAIASALLQLYKDWQTKTTQPIKSEIIQRFNRRVQAAELAQLLNSLTERRTE